MPFQISLRRFLNFHTDELSNRTLFYNNKAAHNFQYESAKVQNNIDNILYCFVMFEFKCVSKLKNGLSGIIETNEFVI